MKKLILITLLALSFSIIKGQAPDSNGILYVKKTATGTGNSWTNAIGELADALLNAKNLNESIPGTVKQIWVAAGTYYPLYSAADNNFGTPDGRNNTFLLVNNVTVHGGFNGTETSLNERTFSPAHESILNGNFNGQKAYHVLMAVSNISESFAINGFTITGGESIDILNEELHTIRGVSVNVQHGAGLYANVSVSVTQCKFTNNKSTLGGGVFANAGGTAYAQISRNIFDGNSALRGGGIYIGMNADVTNNLINNNAAIYMGGGGMCVAGGNVKIFNNNITNNTSSSERGGGIYLFNGNYTIYNNNFQGNTHNLSNIAGSSYPDINYLQGTIDFDYNFVQHYRANTANNVTSGSLENRGDPNSNTDGYKVQVGNMDFEGKKRVQGGRIDIGHLEATHYTPDANGIIYVNKNTLVEGDGSEWTYAAKSLAVVINAAKTNTSIKKIWVAKGTYLPQFKSAETNENSIPTTAVSKTFLWTPDLQVFGGFSGSENPASFDLSLRDFNLNETILSGNLNGNNINNAQHIIIVSGNVGSSALLDGFTIADGKTSGGLSGMDETVNGNLISSRHGAGIYLSNASMELKNLIIKNNSAINSFGSGFGAGLFFSTNQANINLKLKNVTFETNQAGMGAANHTGGNISYENVKFLNNTAVSRGGAMYNSNTNLTVLNTLFKGNKVQDAEPNRGGGAVYSGNSTGTNLKFINTVFAENESPLGGAMTNFDIYGTLNVSLVNCTFYKNTAIGNTDFATAASLFAYGLPNITISNTIFYGNVITDVDDVKDIYPSSAVITLKNSITETYGTHGVDGNMVNINPMFFDAAQGNFALQSGSLAINKGDNTLYTATGRVLLTDKDIAGNPRLDAITIDIGAYESMSVLPVNLTSFTAKLENNAAVLRWETASEKDNESFEIFRSVDAKNFVSLGTVAGKGTTDIKSNYTWYDRLPLNGINYYKLVQKDKDGKTEELGIKPLTFNFNGEEVVLYPNPVKEKANVRFTAGSYNSITLSDISGKTIKTIQLNKLETEKAIPMDNLVNGTYFLRLQGDGKKATVKIIKD